jgi:hypothetical protein
MAKVLLKFCMFSDSTKWSPLYKYFIIYLGWNILPDETSCHKLDKKEVDY